MIQLTLLPELVALEEKRRSEGMISSRILFKLTPGHRLSINQEMGMETDTEGVEWLSINSPTFDVGDPIKVMFNK